LEFQKSLQKINDDREIIFFSSQKSFNTIVTAAAAIFLFSSSLIPTPKDVLFLARCT
jgi:hypothetical protein